MNYLVCLTLITYIPMAAGFIIILTGVFPPVQDKDA
jgi:hypothetical protein